MKLRAFSALLMAFIMMISSASQAQWGYGMYGGMQMCPWGYGAASGASDEEDEIAELTSERRELRREKREIEKAFRQIERDLDSMRDAVTHVVKANWATVILEHMDKGMNCSVCGVQGRPSAQAPVPPSEGLRPPTASAPPVPVSGGTRTERVTIIEQRQEPDPAAAKPTATPAKPVPLPKPTATPVRPQPIQITPPPQFEPLRRPTRPAPNVPKPETPSRGGASLDQNFEGEAGDRAPASVVTAEGRMSSIPNRAPAQEVSAGARVSGRATEAGFEDFGADLGDEQFSVDGSPTLCNPARVPYTMNAWRAICRGEGKIDQRVCRERYFQKGGAKPAEVSACSRALDRYRRLTQEMTKAQNRLVKIEDEISSIGYRIGDIKMERRLDRDMEADCPAGDGSCYERGSSHSRQSKSKGPSLGQTLLAVGLDALSIGGSIYLGREANKWRARTGHEAVPYVATGIAGGAFFPYRTAGLYGGMYGGVNGAFGCSPSMGGGGFNMGPYGMMGPYGVAGGIYGGMNSPFGYPGVPGYPNYGGGMYMPGAGPWGMNGPWGVGGWPGGYPGMPGFVGGIAGGVAGGFAGMPGYAGGFAGMPGFAGGGAGGFAGMPGFAGGFAGMPGFAGGFAGMPGFAGGGAGGFAGMPGFAGGFAGMPGFAGGVAGGFAGMPGFAGGFAGMPGFAGGGAGGFAGMPGFAGGFAGMPGYAGGLPGMPGYAGGLAGGFMTGGMMDPSLAQQQYQLQLEAHRRQTEQAASRLRLYQSFMSEYLQFQMKWNQYFGSGSGGGFLTGPGFGTTPLPGGGSGPSPGSGTVPGRSR